MSEEGLHEQFRPGVEAILRKPAGEFDIGAITGDASDRKYFRLRLRGAPPTVIVMKLRQPWDPNDELPFLSVHRHLEKCGIPVPVVYHHDPARGLVYLEDCGDDSMEKVLRRRVGMPQENRYFTPVDILVTLHTKGSEKAAADGLKSFEMSFDEEKLMWEMDYFIEHYLGGYRGRKLEDDAKARLRALMMEFVRPLALFEPKVLCHRDYHSRNIMLRGDEYFILDFQDARLGLPQYDLASLLRDSYYRLTNHERGMLVDRYVGGLERASGRLVDRAEFMRLFDLQGLQRNIKALGTFGYQASVKHNGDYLRYVPNTVRYIREQLAGRGEPFYAELDGLLGPLL